MATFEQRGLIKKLARLDPFVTGFTVPTDAASAAMVEAAVVFMRRVEAAVEDVAYDILSAVVGTTPPANGEARDLLVWAQKVMSGEIDPRTMLKVALAHTDATTPTDLATMTDVQLKTLFADLAPVMAFGIKK